MAEKLLHLIDRHLTGVEQDCGDRVSKQVRVHPFGNAGPERTPPDDRLHTPDCIPVMPITLEKPAAAAVLEMGPQFLSQRRQYGHIAVGAAFAMNDMDLRRIFVQEQIFDTNVNELAHTRTGQKKRLDEEPFLAPILIRVVNQSLDLASLQALNRSSPPRRSRDMQLMPNLLNDVLGLVVGEVMFAPQPRGLFDDRRQPRHELRLRCLTAQFGLFSARHRRPACSAGVEYCAVSLFCAIVIRYEGWGGGMKFRVQLVIESGNDRPDVVEEIGVFQRGRLSAEDLGLTLEAPRERPRYQAGESQFLAGEALVGRDAVPRARQLCSCSPRTHAHSS
jgi:hypothetical protein